MSSGAMSRGSTEVYIPSVDQAKKPKNSRLGGTPADHKRSRTKGADGEREARDLWRRWFPDCKRTIGQARRGSEAPDIGCAEMNKRYYVEVKRYKKITDGLLKRLTAKMIVDWGAWYGNGGRGGQPILMFRQDNEPWYVVTDPDENTGWRDMAEYEISFNGCGFAVIPWSAFAAALDRLHGGKDE